MERWPGMISDLTSEVFVLASYFFFGLVLICHST